MSQVAKVRDEKRGDEQTRSGVEDTLLEASGGDLGGKVAAGEEWLRADDA